MFAYKLFSSVGLKWCPKANREQVGFWGTNPPNSFTAKINQFKLSRNSHQHINNLCCKVNSPWDTAHGFFALLWNLGTNFELMSMLYHQTNGWQQDCFPAPQARLAITSSFPCYHIQLLQLSWKLCLGIVSSAITTGLWNSPFLGLSD